MMDEPQKSDCCVVAMRTANEIEGVIEESEERRRQAEGNAGDAHTRRTQSRGSVSQGLDRVRERAKTQKKERFTSLLHLIDLERLKAAYLALKRDATPGIDGVNWAQYGQGLESNLLDLHRRLHRGAYRALPAKRRYIPKTDGQKRPLGIAAVEDKVVQRAVVEVLNTIYEEDFLGFSYGFRPGRGQHDALDALAAGITCRKVNWIVDADIRSFFDTVNHEWLMRFVEHRVGDPRLLRLIAKWLKAGVMEEGALRASEQGTPQGATVSPLLANIYLHYVFDLWTERWRRRHARGSMIVVRYADDIVCGFEHEIEARRFMAELQERFRQFDLTLHEQKTRLLQFGRYAAQNRAERGLGKPETFNFLGFTHICGRTRSGAFQLKRKSRGDRMRAKLKGIKEGLRRQMHETFANQGQWLQRVYRGYCAYHAVPTNLTRLRAFRHHLIVCWWRLIRRRSQKDRTSWATLAGTADHWLPSPRILHPWPDRRFRVKHPRWEPSA